MYSLDAYVAGWSLCWPLLMIDQLALVLSHVYVRACAEVDTL